MIVFKVIIPNFQDPYKVLVFLKRFHAKAMFRQHDRVVEWRYEGVVPILIHTRTYREVFKAKAAGDS